MVIFTKVGFIKGSSKDMDNSIGMMEAILKVALKMVSGADKVYGKRVQEWAINMKALLLIIKKKVMEYTHGNQGIYIKGIIKPIWGTDMVRCIGKMVISIKASGKMM